MEDLQRAQRENRASLGIVKPAAIRRVYTLKLSTEKRQSFWQRYNEAVAQIELPLIGEGRLRRCVIRSRLRNLRRCSERHDA